MNTDPTKVITEADKKLCKYCTKWKFPNEGVSFAARSGGKTTIMWKCNACVALTVKAKK